MKTKVAAIVPISALFIVVAVVMALVVVAAMPVQAEEAKDTKTTETKKDDNKTETKPVMYNYEAQAGDSYTKMARKAVQTYGLKYDVKLSGAQIVYAETHMTLDANSPELNVGEKVSVNEADVKTWVEKARDLSDEQKAAWEVYTAGVNFNTDNVGERR